jgi:hypothetical protein
METVDLDADGDLDILLGALNFVNPNETLTVEWEKDKTSILVLMNRGRQSTVHGR